jgi:hypothetical protein
MNIADPLNPVLASNTSLAFSSTYIAGFLGRYIYLFTNSSSINRIYVMDISNPSSPTAVTNVVVPGTSMSGIMHVSGQYLYYIISSTLYTVSLANPASPLPLTNNNFSLIAAISGGQVITTEGRYLYVLDRVSPNGYLERIDLGGLEISSGVFNTLHTDIFQSAGNLTVGGSAFVSGSLTAGQGGLFSQGKLVVSSASTSVFMGGLTIGTSSPFAQFSLWAKGTDGGKVLEIANNASTSIFSILDNGRVGIGTTTPSYALAVEGTSTLGNLAHAGYFIATTSMASIFPYASTTGLTISGVASTSQLRVDSLADGCPSFLF